MEYPCYAGASELEPLRYCSFGVKIPELWVKDPCALPHPHCCSHSHRDQASRRGLCLGTSVEIEGDQEDTGMKSRDMVRLIFECEYVELDVQE